MKIRQYQPKDFQNCRHICYETSDKKMWKNKKEALWLLYCDYYLLEEPDVCFVVANENDEAVGYILAAKNYESYRNCYQQKYYKPLKKASWKMGIFKFFELKTTKKHDKVYPAHLHIDILPEAQRQGFGHQLMDALIAALQQKGVVGVQLGVGASNTKGVNFYQKYGFTAIGKEPGSIIFGLKLT